MLGLCVKPYATNATEALLCGMGSLGAEPAPPGVESLHEYTRSLHPTPFKQHGRAGEVFFLDLLSCKANAVSMALTER